MYTYTVDFYEGSKAFNDELKWLKTFNLAFKDEPSTEEIETQARLKMTVYPRRHTIKWTKVVDEIKIPKSEYEELQYKAKQLEEKDRVIERLNLEAQRYFDMAMDLLYGRTKPEDYK